VLAGVVTGVAVALLLLIVSSSQTPTRQMAFDQDHDVYVHADHHPDAQLIPGIVVVGINGPLFFADADNFRSSVLQLVKATHPHSVVIDLSAVGTMDMDGMRALLQVSRELQGDHAKVLLMNPGKEHTELIQRAGALEEIGADNIHRTVRSAVASAQTAARTSGDGRGSPDG
jgi:anti-anti-sigma factor